MKRMNGVGVAAAALILVAATAWAGDEPSGSPAPDQAKAPASASPASATPVTPMHHMKAGDRNARHMMTDINTASREALLKLPGITDPIADKIIEGRPYKNRDELVSKNVVTKEEFTKIRWRVTAKPAHTAAK